MKTIYMVDGGKGGVGKSMVCAALLDQLLMAQPAEAEGKPKGVLLVETDTSNPDVWKMYRDEVETTLIDLDDANGWIDLVNSCDAHPEAVVVVNGAARNNKGVETYSGTLSNTLEELKRNLVTLWVINRQRDSLELLKAYREALSGSTIHVVRNLHWGAEKQYELYNDSNLRIEIEESGGFSLNFPDLADRVADDLYSRRLSIAAAMKELPIGNRAELTRWRGEVRKMFEEVLDV